MSGGERKDAPETEPVNGRRGDDETVERVERKHDHPGGAGAVLGMRVLRFSGVQGISLGFGNLFHMVSVVVVAHALGPANLGQYALLLFLAGLTSHVMGILVKPGTIRRTFGGGDDEDDDDDDDASEIASDPRRALGVGICWAAVLGLIAAGVIVIFRKPIADGLLGDPREEALVFWSGILAGASVLFKIASLVLWLERRPKAFLLADLSRPILGLAGVVVMTSIGLGVKGAIIGQAGGACVAAALSVFMLRHSFDAALTISEIKEVIKRGGPRMPIAMSMWLMQNADVFVLSRAGVDHHDIGLYNLASRLGIMVSIFPQGLRVAMRPLKKSAAFKAVREEYGDAVQRGQLLGYYVLLCIAAVLAMVLGGKILIDVAPPAYRSAAPLIPLSAASFVMPALYRSINQNVMVPNKRLTFVLGMVAATALFIGLCALLAPSIGIYAAPAGILTGFVVPSTYMFVRCQLSDKRIEFPYRNIGVALVLAALAAGVFHALPHINKWLELGMAAIFFFAWIGLLIAFRAIPEMHWRPLLHMGRSAFKGTTVHKFDPSAGIAALAPSEREELRTAISEHVDRDRLKDGYGETLVLYLRRAGSSAGFRSVAESGPVDMQISIFLFERAPTAVRNVSMNKAQDQGADANDLRALEELVQLFAKAPPGIWTGVVESRVSRWRTRLSLRPSA